MIRKLFQYGKTQLFLWGAEGDDDDEGTDDQSGSSGSGDDSPETRTITTEELEAMTSRAADRATRKAKKELASSMGFESLSELNEFVSST